MDDKYKFATRNINDTLVIGAGIEGTFDAVQWGPNVVSRFPYTDLASKKNIQIDLPQEYTDYMSKFDHVVLVSFGTSFNPSNST